ncbi:MAG TPA: hypothetical protein PK544_05395 [Spirochaetota bacterium]|nr:hypothetical protein [Spirochaetota bacterium]HPJ37591.1 hypothetical protein [Spirochaetota bacterium]HPQ51985.1 hypothetical protein [Spirochaetota bacterium]
MKGLEQAIVSSKPVRLVAYSVSPVIESALKKILFTYLKAQGCEVLHDSLYTAVKELLINAIKANYKNIYFENYSSKNKAEEIIGYNTALELFKLELGRDEGTYLSNIARNRNMNAEIIWRQTGEQMRVDVVNPVSMTELEIQNVRKKMDFARRCVDISEYFLNEEDDPNQEGAGLGLILIMMILKSLGGGDENFFINSGDGKTTATLIVPLTEATLAQYQKHIE